MACFATSKSPWRNWLARLTVNQEVGSSSLPGDADFFFLALLPTRGRPARFDSTTPHNIFLSIASHEYVGVLNIHTTWCYERSTIKNKHGRNPHRNNFPYHIETTPLTIYLKKTNKVPCHQSGAKETWAEEKQTQKVAMRIRCKMNWPVISIDAQQ